MTPHADPHLPAASEAVDDGASSDAPAAPASTLGQTPHEPTVRPWEQELLISGAVVFALLQLPAAVDDWVAHLRPRLSETGGGALIFLYMYMKLTLYTLIGSFLVHLGVRAYWVGMIGLESVFPRGIVWENTQLGPVGREVQRKRVPSLQALIDRSDRVASVVFGVGFTVALIFVLTVGIGAVYWAISIGLSSLIFGGEYAPEVLLALAVATALPPVLLLQADRRLGRRLTPGSRGWRMMDRAYGLFYYAQGQWLFGPAMMTVFSNFHRRRALPAFIALMYGIIAFMLVKDVLIARDRLSTDAYLYVPENPGRLGVEADYYEDKREAGKVAALPSIQSDVIRDPYVRLFIAYAPDRHNRLFARRCPGVRPFHEGVVRIDGSAVDPEQPAEADAVLRCWARVQPVAVNGRPLAAPLRFYRHPVTGLQGVVAHIPVAGLPRGENVITVTRLPPPAEIDGKAPARTSPPHYIPFWL